MMDAKRQDVSSPAVVDDVRVMVPKLLDSTNGAARVRVHESDHLLHRVHHQVGVLIKHNGVWLCDLPQPVIHSLGVAPVYGVVVLDDDPAGYRLELDALKALRKLLGLLVGGNYNGNRV